MSKGVAIFLCNWTMSAAQPWVDGGYRVVLIDPQHPVGIHHDGLVTRVGFTLQDAMKFIGWLIASGEVVFVFGFPPCTDVAVSGSRWFAAKAKKDPHFQAKAALIAEQCLTIGRLSGVPYGFENPVSVFSSIFGKPDYTFSPDEYTGYCADDNYTKKTCLWTGGGFIMPHKFKDESLGKPDDRIHKAPPGPDRQNFRSASPAGFFRAVYLANAPHLKTIRVAA